MSEMVVKAREYAESAGLTPVPQPNDAPKNDRGWSGLALHEGTTRYRISILAFEEAGRFRLAAQELLLHGFNSAQFCLFGHSYVLSTIEHITYADEGPSSALEGLLTAPSCSIRLAGPETFEMRCGTFAGSLFSSIEKGLAEATWMREDLAQGIASDVADGRLVLLVTSVTADQHALGAKLLLRHGNRDLLTHEFTAGR